MTVVWSLLAEQRALEAVDYIARDRPDGAEIEAVAKRQSRELGLAFADIDDVLDYVCSIAEPHAIFYLWRPFLPDPRDDLVLELAVEAQASCIITHNLRDFAGTEQFGIEALSPGAFQRRLEASV